MVLASFGATSQQPNISAALSASGPISAMVRVFGSNGSVGRVPKLAFLKSTNERSATVRANSTSPGQIEVLPRSLVQECMDDQIVRAQILFAESGEPPHRFFLGALLQTALIPAGSGKKVASRSISTPAQRAWRTAALPSNAVPWDIISLIAP